MNSILNCCRKANFFYAIIIGLVLLLNGCASLHMQTEPEYYIGFMNKTGQRLDGVAAYYGNVEVAAKGILVENGRATYGAVTMPIPLEAEVRWDEDGRHYAIKAKLHGIVPKGFGDDGTVYFVINTNGVVDVVPIKSGDTAALMKLEDGGFPK